MCSSTSRTSATSRIAGSWARMDVAKHLRRHQSHPSGPDCETASNAPVDSPEEAARFTAALGLDVTAYHDARQPTWYELGVTQSVVRALKSNGRPAYLQEPMGTRDNRFAIRPTTARNISAGHRPHQAERGRGVVLSHRSRRRLPRRPSSFEDRLRSHPEPEWAFVSSLNARVALRTNNGVNYVVAEGGGGGGVRADLGRRPAPAAGRFWAFPPCKGGR